MMYFSPTLTRMEPGWKRYQAILAILTRIPGTGQSLQSLSDDNLTCVNAWMKNFRSWQQVWRIQRRLKGFNIAAVSTQETGRSIISNLTH